MIIRLLVAAVLLAPAVSRAAEAPSRVVEKAVPLKQGVKARVSVDKGQLTVTASKSGTLTYKVEFTPDSKPSWWSRSSAPAQKDYDACAVEFDAKSGLRVTTVKGISALVSIGVPEATALDAALSAGILKIGPRTGPVEGFIGSGILEFDASALPASVCVRASVNAGTVNNARDFNCETTAARLHGHSGIITVK